MKLTYGYPISPGCCFSCRSATSPDPTKMPKVIDLDRDDPAELRRSRVYLCETCVTAAYQMLDATKVLVEADLIADKDAEIASLGTKIAELTTEARVIDTRLAKAAAAQ